MYTLMCDAKFLFDIRWNNLQVLNELYFKKILHAYMQNYYQLIRLLWISIFIRNYVRRVISIVYLKSRFLFKPKRNFNHSKHISWQSSIYVTNFCKGCIYDLKPFMYVSGCILLWYISFRCLKDLKHSLTW